ncbi:MAG TPA: hypothetical protein VFI95_14655 [Terriglobales bacterium]|nr:hypothetical protein [Terriglobales bacterium]
MRRNLLALAVLTILLASITIAATKPSAKGGNGWSGAVPISPILQPDPTRGSQLNDVAVNANGLAIAAWDQFVYTGSGSASIGAAVQSGGRWSAPFTISGTTGFSMSPKVAVGGDGTMAVSWIYQNPAGTEKSIQVAVKTPSASAWTTSTLATWTMGGVSLTEFAPVAVDANGNVTAAWDIWNGAIHLVQAATMLKGSAWSAPVTLSGSDDGLYTSLAINARGDAAVVYSYSPYSSYPSGTSARYVFRSGPAGAWSAPLTISETIPSSVGYVQYPQAALDGNGLATVIYSGYGVEAVRQVTSTTWTQPQTVLKGPGTLLSAYTSVDIGVDVNGNAVVAASIFDSTINVDRSSVWVTRGTPDGVWTPEQRITDPTVPVDAYATRVAVSADGALAMVGWIDHYHGAVQVSKLVSGAWSAANTIGKGTAWASFQEVMGLDAGSSTVARAIWKNAKTGVQVMAASYGQ